MCGRREWRASLRAWLRNCRPSRTGHGAPRATPCTLTPRSSGSSRRRSLLPNPSCSTPRCASPRAAGKPPRCRRPTARGRSWSRSTSALTKRWSSTATDARRASRSRLTARWARSRAPSLRPWRARRRRGDQHHAAGGVLERAARRGRGARAAMTPTQVAAYFAAATRAALVLAAFRAPYRGRSTPVNAWWGSFDLAVNLFSGASGRSAVARLHHAQRDGRPGGRDRLVARRHPLRAGRVLRLRPPRSRCVRRSDTRTGCGAMGGVAGRVHPRLGRRPRGRRPARARARVRPLRLPARVHRCEWDPALAASAHATPPPIA